VELVAEDMRARIRKYPTQWKLRRFLRFINGPSVHNQYIGELPWYFRDMYKFVVRVDGDFRGSLFMCEYGTTVPLHNTDYNYRTFPTIDAQVAPQEPVLIDATPDYIPLSQNTLPPNTLSLENHYFIFRECRCAVYENSEASYERYFDGYFTVNGSDTHETIFEVYPDRFVNVYMLRMYRAYLLRITKAYGCKYIKLHPTMTPALPADIVQTLHRLQVHVDDPIAIPMFLRSTFVHVYPYHVSCDNDVLEVYFECRL